MSALAHLYLPGALTLWCALAFGLASLWGYTQLARGDESARTFARRAYTFFAIAIALSAVVMAILLARRDFRIDYVFSYSGTDLPFHYQLAAFWAGQKGSFLIWLLFGALIGIPLIRTTGRQEAPVMGIYTLAQLGILFILVRESPFLMLDHAPIEGQGLNPLLQDDWMVIHPPIMFVGYALSVVPFAFAMSALLVRDTKEWAARAFPWALAGFLVLGSAILMGGYWAYKTLGWGGYWGWDPVENASLIPWLLGTALVHGLYLERTRGRFRRANFVLASLVFLAVLYGTFLTRSGVLADFSVHSFVDLGISGWLVAGMAFFFGMSVWLIGTRLRGVPTEVNEDPLLSRGTFLVLGSIALLTTTAVVTLGTSAPLLTRFLENPGQVGPEFYNRVNFPLALGIAVLLSLVPFLTWRGETTPRQLLRKMAPGLIVGFLAAAFAAGLGVHDPFHLALVMLAGTAIATNIQKTVAKARAGGLAAAGGYLAHVGVGIILLGFLASSAYDQSVKVTLVQGEPANVGAATLTFQRFLPREGKLKERAEVLVEQANGRSYTAYPQIFLNERTRQLMVHPHIRSFLLADYYLSPLEFDPGQPEQAVAQLALEKDQVQRLADLDVRFLGFDTGREGGAMAQMASGGPVTIAALLEVTHEGETSRLEALYRFRRDGEVEFPPVDLPGGGQVALGGIDATAGAVRLLFAGVEGTAQPARLSLDVTRKPLIQLVWGGFYVILAGGLLAIAARARQVRLLGRLPERAG